MNGVSTLWVLTALAGLIGVLIVWLQRHPREMRHLMKTSGEKGVMSAQYDPHTPLWRRFLSLPQTRLGWWAAGLASIASIALVIFAMTPTLLPEGSVTSPPGLGAAVELITVPTSIVAPLAGGVVGSLALGAGERSLLVWFAQVPAAIFFAVLTSIFQEGSFWVNGSPGVLVWAAIAFGIGYLRHGYLRQERSS